MAPNSESGDEEGRGKIEGQERGSQLETLQPKSPHLRLLQGAPREQQGTATPWRLSDPKGAEEENLGTIGVRSRDPRRTHVRDVTFAEADVLLASDYSLEDLMRWCREEPLVVQVRLHLWENCTACPACRVNEEPSEGSGLAAPAPVSSHPHALPPLNPALSGT